MKNIVKILSIILLVTLIACNNNGEINAEKNNLSWEGNLEQLIELAQKENKTVFVYFTGSDWCKWCFRLNDEVLSQEEFEKYAEENLVLVKLDFPKNKMQKVEEKRYNNNLMQKFQIRGFPTVLLFNGDGKMLGATGYQAGGAAKYTNHLNEIITKAG